MKCLKWGNELARQLLTSKTLYYEDCKNIGKKYIYSIQQHTVHTLLLYKTRLLPTNCTKMLCTKCSHMIRLQSIIILRELQYSKLDIQCCFVTCQS